jgi:hypothetical protein
LTGKLDFTPRLSFIALVLYFVFGNHQLSLAISKAMSGTHTALTVYNIARLRVVMGTEKVSETSLAHHQETDQGNLKNYSKYQDKKTVKIMTATVTASAF